MPSIHMEGFRELFIALVILNLVINGMPSILKIGSAVY